MHDDGTNTQTSSFQLRIESSKWEKPTIDDGLGHLCISGHLVLGKHFICRYIVYCVRHF